MNDRLDNEELKLAEEIHEQGRDAFGGNHP